MKKYTPGTKAYWDTLRGLVPCKVTEVFDEYLCSTSPAVKALRIEITKDTGPWKKGEIQQVSPIHVYPTTQVRKTKYGHLLVNGFEWVQENTDD